MQACMKGCRWCPLVPVVLGIILFLLGYFQNAETVRVLWLVFFMLSHSYGYDCFDHDEHDL